MNFSKKRSKLTVAILVLTSLISLTGCGGASNGLQNPQLNIYLLDLTGSGSTSDQLRRIYADIETDVTVDNLGQPFGAENEIKSPEISQIFFVGTNSRYLLDFTLQDFGAIKALFDFNFEENNSSNAERIWGQISHSINLILSDNIEFGNSALTNRECDSKLNADLEGLFSDSKRPDYVEKACEIIVYSSKQYFDFKNYVDVQSKIQSHSDVFGAMSAINDKIGQFLKQYPTGSVKVIMASDGDHNIHIEDYKDLKTAMLQNEDVCAYARKLGSNKSFKNLLDARVDMSDKPGVGALGADTSSTAEYANKLSQFWNCFPK